MKNDASLSNEELALSNCAREPVHIPGRIQSWGALIAFDRSSDRVLHYSSNLLDLFPGIGAIDFEQTYVELLADTNIVHAIRGALSLPSIDLQRDRVGWFLIGSVPADISVYVVGDIAVVELEPDEFAKSKPQSAVSVTRSMLATLNQSEGPREFLGSAAIALRHLTGHDRVMAYRFLENGDGEVVAESTSPGIAPFLGLRYPASDIPIQVRQIMLRAPFRLIENTESDPAGLVSAPDAGPLDMTLGHLRGVSPIHIEYLQNMGVRSTMNTSIIVNGKLWGLFAFHHNRRRRLSPDQRSICELFGHFASLHLQQKEEAEKLDRLQRTRSTVSAIDTAGENVEEVFEALHSDFANSINANGIALVRPDVVWMHGSTPNEESTREIAKLCLNDSVSIDSLVATDSASEISLGKSAGVLALKLDPLSTLAFFRDEVVHEIRWAGQLEKTITHGPNGPRLTPRASFEEYRESQRGRCVDWSQADLLAAKEISRGLQKRSLVDFQDENLSYRRQNLSYAREKRFQDLLIAELNHRVRNTLALVRSIARQTGATSKSVENYVESFEKRITALSTAHSLVGGSGLQWAFLTDLIDCELRPYLNSDENVTLEGPPIALRPDVAPVVSLLIHELLSNAIRHGGLSPNGKALNVKWYEKDGGVAISWIETFVNEVSQPKSMGFGMSLIERAIPYECNGLSEIKFAGSEYRVQFWLPAESIIRGVNRKTEPNQEKLGTTPKSFAKSLSFKNALVLEDNMVLAMEVQKTLRDLGIPSVETVSNVSDAQEILARLVFDCAVLDINLGGENCFPVAETLCEAKIPTVLVSGYDSKFELPESLRTLPKLTKPVGRLDLARALSMASQTE